MYILEIHPHQPHRERMVRMYALSRARGMQRPFMEDNWKAPISKFKSNQIRLYTWAISDSDILVDLDHQLRPHLH